jgi:hypothetical protein
MRLKDFHLGTSKAASRRSVTRACKTLTASLSQAGNNNLNLLRQPMLTAHIKVSKKLQEIKISQELR